MMSLFHDGQPLIGAAFARGNRLPHPVAEDFGAPARDRIKPCDNEPPNHFLDRLA